MKRYLIFGNVEAANSFGGYGDFVTDEVSFKDAVNYVMKSEIRNGWYEIVDQRTGNVVLNSNHDGVEQ